MSFLNTALSAAGGALQGYSGGQQQRPPAPGQRRDQGALMQYLRRKVNPVSGAPQTDPGLPPDGMQVPMGIPPSVGGPPSIAPPPQNPYQNPYPRRPPMQMQGEPDQSATSAYGQQFAEGGIVDHPTTAIIGEDGPEMVVPLSGRPDAKVSPRNLPQMNYGRR